MSCSEESDSGRRYSDEEEEEKVDEEREELGSQAGDEFPAATPVRSQKGTARARSAVLNSLAFPISRVRRLVKSEGDMLWVGVEAGFLIAKAAELFVEKFVEESFVKMAEDERSSLQYRDLASHVCIAERMDFLGDIVPVTVSGSAAMAAKENADR